MWAVVGAGPYIRIFDSKRPAGMAGLCYQLTFSVTPGTLAMSRATAAVRMISGTM